LDALAPGGAPGAEVLGAAAGVVVEVELAPLAAAATP
jgi:hypothetical protein